MFNNCCFSCLRSFESRDDLLNHLHTRRHSAFIPDIAIWDQPQSVLITFLSSDIIFVQHDRDLPTPINFLCADNLIIRFVLSLGVLPH